MKKKTTDPNKIAIENFLVANGLKQAVEEYFASDFVQKRLNAGYEQLLIELIEIDEAVPKELDELAEEAAQKVDLSRDEFKAEALEIFCEGFTQVFQPATLFININSMLLELLQNHENEELILLVEGAMEDIRERTRERFHVLLMLLWNGMPMELAEKFMKHELHAVEVSILTPFDCDEEGDESDEDGNEDCKSEHCHCNGECGGNCNCKEKDDCEDAGRCLRE